MKTPCEINVKLIIPAVRAVIVQELHEKYGKNQNEIASLLGLTQPSVSHYLRGERGARGLEIVREQPAFKSVQDLIEKLIGNKMSDMEVIKEICIICMMIRPKFVEKYLEGVDPASILDCDKIPFCK
ncbi:MAG: transcriptional regulator [Candidatus Helarchaeota archaeon]|nr:transcriptional regulator [Candidatus Helarchaeota archaeon]